MSLLHRARARLMNAPYSGFAERQARDEQSIRALLRRELELTARCIDVGAHVGRFLDLFLKYAPQGQHLAVEPLPELAGRLSERYRGVQVEQCVLGDLDGETRFYRQVDRPAWSSLAAGHGLGGPVEPFTVPMRRLDDLVDRADFLKIDVEGAELGVLRGASRLLETGMVVLFEHAHIHAQHFDSTPADVWEELAQHNREVFGLAGGGALSRNEFERVCASARETKYGRDAETNFLSRRV